MAKERMITRTIITTKVVVKYADIDTSTIDETSYILPGKYDDANKALDAVKATHDTETRKHLMVVDFSSIEKLYGMSEEAFLANAVELPPR